MTEERPRPGPTAPESTAGLAGRAAVAAVLAAATALYVASAAPGVLWGDSAKLALMALELDLRTNPGGHPGYVLLAGALVRSIPVDAARLLNLLSALSGAAAVAATFAVGRRLGGPAAGLVAAGTLAVAHVHWLAASIAETYAPAMAALAVALLALLRWRARAARGGAVAPAAIAGLALGFGGSVNAVVLLAAPGLVLPLVARLRGGRARTAFLLSGLAGLAPYWAVALARGDVGGLGGGVGFELAAYLGGPGTLRELARMPAYLAYQLPGPALLLAPAGAVVLWRRGDRGLAAALPLAAGAVVLFSALWLRQRQFFILGAAVLPLAVLAGVAAPAAAAWIADRRRVGRPAVLAALLVATVLLPPATYLATPPLAAALGLDLVGARELPYRGAAYYLRPWKTGYRGTERYVAEAAAPLRAGDVVYADFTVERPLVYALSAGTLPAGVEIRETDRFVFANDPAALVAEIEEALEAGRRVFLADDHRDYYFLAELSERFEPRPEGVLVRVLPATPAR